MSGETTNWTELREFKAVELTSSFVLSWHCEGDDLVLDLDVCLAPEHPFYEKPRRSESACIRPALLEFPGCRRLTPGAGEARRKPIDKVATDMGHGRISGLRRVGEGVYELQGEFGSAVVEADRPLLRLGVQLP